LLENRRSTISSHPLPLRCSLQEKEALGKSVPNFRFIFFLDFLPGKLMISFTSSSPRITQLLLQKDEQKLNNKTKNEKRLGFIEEPFTKV